MKIDYTQVEDEEFAYYIANYDLLDRPFKTLTFDIENHDIEYPPEVDGLNEFQKETLVFLQEFSDIEGIFVGGKDDEDAAPEVLIRLYGRRHGLSALVEIDDMGYISWWVIPD